ncbi:hypothetical protein T265_01264 [Opisthorchis viverrini]|uniref:Doublecortin domain-containing protein n=1 Tax=Opisthorchis viverrini TaxID=6198 RepID=A0A075A0B5_OPIVI|nr:hypothetical protein T265_01264 [Opisthorchis viverrini]KER32786.1 hypothetical protein T265_01264 [Opisthorchis viverrini]
MNLKKMVHCRLNQLIGLEGRRYNLHKCSKNYTTNLIYPRWWSEQVHKAVSDRHNTASRFGNGSVLLDQSTVRLGLANPVTTFYTIDGTPIHHVDDLHAWIEQNIDSIHKQALLWHRWYSQELLKDEAVEITDNLLGINQASESLEETIHRHSLDLRVIETAYKRVPSTKPVSRAIYTGHPDVKKMMESLSVSTNNTKLLIVIVSFQGILDGTKFGSSKNVCLKPMQLDLPDLDVYPTVTLTSHGRVFQIGDSEGPGENTLYVLVIKIVGLDGLKRISQCTFRVSGEPEATPSGNYGAGVVLNPWAECALLGCYPVNCSLSADRLTDSIKINALRHDKRCLLVVSAYTQIDISCWIGFTPFNDQQRSPFSIPNLFLTLLIVRNCGIVWLQKGCLANSCYVLLLYIPFSMNALRWLGRVLIMSEDYLPRLTPFTQQYWIWTTENRTFLTKANTNTTESKPFRLVTAYEIFGNQIRSDLFESDTSSFEDIAQIQIRSRPGPLKNYFTNVCPKLQVNILPVLDDSEFDNKKDYTDLQSSHPIAHCYISLKSLNVIDDVSNSQISSTPCKLLMDSPTQQSTKESEEDDRGDEGHGVGNKAEYGFSACVYLIKKRSSDTENHMVLPPTEDESTQNEENLPNWVTFPIEVWASCGEEFVPLHKIYDDSEWIKSRLEAEKKADESSAPITSDSSTSFNSLRDDGSNSRLQDPQPAPERPKPNLPLTAPVYKQPQRKRIFVYKNREVPSKNVLVWGDNLDAMMQDASSKLGCTKNPDRFCTLDGNRINQLKDLRQDQIVCLVCCGERFIVPKEIRQAQISANWVRARRKYGPEATDIVVQTRTHPFVNVDPFELPNFAQQKQSQQQQTNQRGVTTDHQLTHLRFDPYHISYHSAVTPFRCLAATPPEAGTRARILPGCPSLDRRNRDADVGLEPRTFQSVNSRFNQCAISSPCYDFIHIIPPILNVCTFLRTANRSIRRNL